MSNRRQSGYFTDVDTGEETLLNVIPLRERRAYAFTGGHAVIGQMERLELATMKLTAHEARVLNVMEALMTWDARWVYLPQTRLAKRIDMDRVNFAKALAKLVNRGVEISLNSVNVQKGDLRWSSNINFSTNHNEILELYGGTIKRDVANNICSIENFIIRKIKPTIVCCFFIN